MKQEGKHTAEFFLAEAEGHLSRDEVTIVAGAGPLERGTVVGRITSSQKFTAYDADAIDGRHIARGVLYAAVPASEDDQSAVIIAREATVDAAELIGLDANARTSLRRVGIVCR